MQYPVEILPGANYKLIDCDISEFFLIRHIDIPADHDLIDEVTNTINTKYICVQSDHIDDLSMSLLSIYKVEHIHIKLTPPGNLKYNHFCNPDEEVPAPVFNDDYIREDQRRFWCAKLKYLNNESFDYLSSNQPMIAKCIVKHTPMRWNYWHFSLDWEIDTILLSSMEQGSKRKNIARKIGHSVKTAIAVFAKSAEPIIEELRKDCYCKN